MDQLSRVCKRCGRELWEHVARKCEGTEYLDLMPCLPWLVSMIGQEKWRQRADDQNGCRQCGKPFLNHFVFERMSFVVMGTSIWHRNSHALLFPVSELSCDVVSEEGPLLGRHPPTKNPRLAEQSTRSKRQESS